MTSQSPSSPSNKTEERILQNALQHFCSYGYNGTSVREITSASEVTKPTLYYYFKNKEELFIRLAESCFGMVLTNLNSSIPAIEGYEPGIRALFECRDRIATENPAALKFIHSLIVSPQRGTPDVGVKVFVKKIEERLDGILQSAVHKGECREDKRAHMRIMVVALLGFHPMAGLSEDAAVLEKLTVLIENLCKCSGNASCPP